MGSFSASVSTAAARLLFAAALLSVVGGRANAQSVKDYAPFFAECTVDDCGKRLIVLRSFKQSGEKRLLTVDPETLETEVRPEKGLHLRRMSWPDLRAVTLEEPYGHALAAGEINGASRQDAGITHALPDAKGVVLTVDLCPSPHRLDRRIFDSVLEAFSPEERPVPIGIAITGRWMQERGDDLKWIRELETRGDLRVTWIDHSFNHRYAKGLPLSQNFLLETGTDLRREILGTEALMIENGLRPSIFFRFPGLVSNLDLVKRVASYGLVPVGSDAWLAKNQAPSPGSIVLVHGNGNEALGIKRLLRLLRQEKAEISSGNWLLFDLRDSVRREEKTPKH